MTNYIKFIKYINILSYIKYIECLILGSQSEIVLT